MKPIYLPQFMISIWFLCVGTISNSQNISIVKNNPIFPTYKNFISISTAIEVDKAPNVFFTLDYLFAPGVQRNYYMGLGFYVTGKGSSSHNHVGHNDKTTIVSFYTEQKYFFRPSKKVSPFIGLNGGIRLFAEDVSNTYRKNSKIFIFPISYNHTDSIFQTNQSSVTIAPSAGLKINIDNTLSFITSLEVRTTKAFNYYEGVRKPAIITLCAGLILQTDQRSRRYYNKHNHNIINYPQ